MPPVPTSMPSIERTGQATCFSIFVCFYTMIGEVKNLIGVFLFKILGWVDGSFKFTNAIQETREIC